MMECKKNQYAFQLGKEISIGSLQGQTKVLWNLEDDERKLDFDKAFQTDKPFQWSPMGTYLIVINSDRVQFISSADMKPILEIMEPLVQNVTFSPCEKYIVLQIKKEKPYEVWNF